MELKLPKSMVASSTNGGENAIDAMIRINHPNELSWEKYSDSLYLTYKFRLDFDSKDDYVNKVESILGRDVNVILVSSNTPIARGMRIKEDFTSEDLLYWIKQCAVEQDLLNQEENNLLNVINTKVVYNGEEIQTENYINVNRLAGVPIEKVSINTRVLKDNSFIRSIEFVILGDLNEIELMELGKYFETRTPYTGQNSLDRQDNSYIFKIDFLAQDVKELKTYTNQVLDNSIGEIYFESFSDKLFNEQIRFNEKISLDYFAAAHPTGKIYTEYSLTFDDLDISEAKINKNGTWVNSNESLNENSFSTYGQANVLHIDITSREKYSLSNISINTIDNNDGTFNRIISLIFDDDDQKYGAEKAANYFDSKQAPYVNIEANKNICNLNIIGTAQELNIAMNSLFGPGNTIKYKSNKSFNPFNRFELEDNIDLSTFLSELSYNGRDILYTYTTPNKIDAIFKTDLSNNKIKSINIGDKMVFAYKLASDESVKFTILSKDLNYLFISLISLIILITILVLLALIILIVRAIRMRDLKINLDDGQIVVFEKLADPCEICGSTVYKGTAYCMNCGNIVGEIIEDNNLLNIDD